MSEAAKITMYGENQELIELYVIEETRINNVDYLLVADGDDDGSEAYILKDQSAPEAEEAVYSFVEDAEELDYIGRIFAELLEENDIGLE